MHRIIYLTLISILILQNLNGQNNSSAIKLNELNNTKLDSSIVNQNQLNLKLNSILNQYEKNQVQLKGQNELLSQVMQQLENPERNVFSEFVYPIILSVLAAIIFWFAFSHIPEQNRKQKIRRKIDLEIYQVYSRLFALFDIIMRRNSHSPSDYQHVIRGKKLSRRDIEIGLQNKCLNESYIFYPELKNRLFPIGKSLWKYENKIDKIIDKLYSFSMYLHSDEILLFENIRNKLNTYEFEDYNRNAFTVIGGMNLHPINPSISYMTNNFFELYALFIELQNLVFKNKLENRDIHISKVQYLFYSEQYEATIKTIKIGYKKYAKDNSFLDTYVFQSYYKQGKQNEAYRKLEAIFETKLHLVSSRNSLKDYLEDKKVNELLVKYFSDSQIDELNIVIQQEELIEKSFVAEAKQLEEFYTKKANEKRNK